MIRTYFAVSQINRTHNPEKPKGHDLMSMASGRVKVRLSGSTSACFDESSMSFSAAIATAR